MSGSLLNFLKQGRKMENVPIIFNSIYNYERRFIYNLNKKLNI